LRPQLPGIYPITDTEISGLSHTEQTKRLIEGGAKLIQFREKRARAGEWFDDASDAVRICREAGVLSIINDRVDIAIAVNADGMHLGQDDLPVAAARRLLGPKKIIGLSTHTPEQLRAALLEPIDYVAMGPIFDTSTKSRPDPTVGLEKLSEAVEMAGNVPLVAIGGITEDAVAAVLGAGASSAAMIGAILADPGRIAARYRELAKIASKC